MHRRLLTFLLLALSIAGVVSTIAPNKASAATKYDGNLQVIYKSYGEIEVKTESQIFTGGSFKLGYVRGTQNGSGSPIDLPIPIDLDVSNDPLEAYYTPDGTGWNIDGEDINSCSPQVVINNINYTDGMPTPESRATVYFKQKNPNGGSQCTTVVKDDAGLTNWSDRARVLFKWVDKNTIAPTSQIPYVKVDRASFRPVGALELSTFGNFLNNAATGSFVPGNPPECPSTLSSFNADKTTALMRIWNTNASGKCEDNYTTSTLANIDNPENANKEPDPNAPVEGTGESDETQSQPQLDCDAGVNPLNWLLCALVKGGVTIVGSMDGYITDALKTGNTGADKDKNDAPSLFGDDSAYKKAWVAFRNIALGLLVVAGLIMIVSEALGLGFLDAYTIKKVLPRLLTAAILITLSWPLMQFFVEFTNILGYGVRSLILTPFSGIDGKVDIGGGGDVAVGLAAGIAAASLGIIGLLSFVLTAVIAVFTAFLILVARQIIIAALVIIAPIAILMYVLPNTNSIFRMWFMNFIKILLMFPIIMAMISAGRAFSAVAAASATNTFGSFMAFAAYFAPYFLVPAALKYSGGAMGVVGGALANSTKGMSGGVAKFRQNRRKELNAKRLNNAKNFSTFSDNNRVGRGLNTALGAGVMAMTKPTSLTKRGAVTAQRHAARVNGGAEQLKNDGIFTANQNDDNFLLALANKDLAGSKLNAATNKFNQASYAANQFHHEDKSAAAMKARSDAASAQADMDARSNGLRNASMVQSKNSAGTRLAALNGLAKTGYQFGAGEVGYKQLEDTVTSIVGNDGGLKSAAMNEAQFHLKNAGKLDMAGINNGAGSDIKSGARKQNGYQRSQGKVDTYHGMAQAFLGRKSTDSEGRTGKVEDIAAGLNASLREGSTSVKDVSEYHSMLIRDKESATDGNKIEIQKQIEAMESVAQGFSSTGDTSFEAELVNNNRTMRGAGMPSEYERTKKP